MRAYSNFMTKPPKEGRHRTNRARTDANGGAHVPVEGPPGQAGGDEVEEEVDDEQGSREAAADVERHGCQTGGEMQGQEGGKTMARELGAAGKRAEGVLWRRRYKYSREPLGTDRGTAVAVGNLGGSVMAATDLPVRGFPTVPFI